MSCIRFLFKISRYFTNVIITATCLSFFWYQEKTVTNYFSEA